MKKNRRPETEANQPETEFTTLGFYEPGFIHLRVNALDNLNRLMDKSEPAEWVPTFLHEYVHFLQDITSTHGLLNFIHAVEHLKNANKQVTENASTGFSIPLKISNVYNWETNRKLKEVYRGCDRPVKSIGYLDYRETVERIPASGGSTITVPKYHVNYYDNGAQTKMTCHFGAIHIKEYMAHALQKQFDPVTAHADIPYRLAELIVNKETPQLAGNAPFIIALCDASLMDFHPARLFFHTLERIKSIPDWTPTDADSIYALAFKDLRLSGTGRTETFESLYDETAKSAAQAFRDSLKADIFKSNVLWFENLIREARNLRLNRRGFFSKLVSSPGNFSRMFTQIVNTLGVPFTTNAESRGYFVPPEKLKSLVIQPYLPKVFQAISKTYGGCRECSLHPFCGENITNDDCKNKPWARVDLPELCPYAQLWKTWGLSGRKPLPSGISGN